MLNWLFPLETQEKMRKILTIRKEKVNIPEYIEKNLELAAKVSVGMREEIDSLVKEVISIKKNVKQLVKDLERIKKKGGKK